MNTGQRTRRRTIAASLFLLLLWAVPGFANDAKFRPATGSTSIAARYRVALTDDASGEEDEKVAASLIATYGGRIEPYAEQGFRGFLVTMSTARARMLSTDARVLWVEEQLPENQAAPIFTPALQSTAVTSIATTAAKNKVGSDWVREGTLWDSGAYSYDGAGNVTAIGDVSSDATSLIRDVYSYDQAGRLLTATAHTPGRDNQQTYTYDRYGNLIGVTTSGAPPRAISVDATTNQLASATYDDAGSQLTVQRTNIHYTWDSLSMLTKRDEGEAGGTPLRVEQYVYDAGDERIAIITGSTETYSVRGLDHKVMREFVFTTSNQTWRIESDYVYRGSVLLASFRGDGEGPGPHRHFHVDHLGTPRLITDAAGYKLALRTYWPFGSEAPGSEWLGEKLQFTGHERDYSGDPDRNLDYMHARYYGSGWGRFVSVDPKESANRNTPQSWNRYSYAMNNPLIYIDPDGMEWFAVLQADSRGTLKHEAIVNIDLKTGAYGETFEHSAYEDEYIGNYAGSYGPRNHYTPVRFKFLGYDFNPRRYSDPNSNASYKEGTLQCTMYSEIKQGGSAKVGFWNRLLIAFGFMREQDARLSPVLEDRATDSSYKSRPTVPLRAPSPSGAGDPQAFHGALVDGVWMNFYSPLIY